MYGEQNGKAKLTERQVRSIRQRYQKGEVTQMNYVVKRQEQEFGPYTLSDLQEYVEAGLAEQVVNSSAQASDG